MYHEARTDRKLESLTDSEHRIWFNLICFAAAQEEHRGTIQGYDADLLAVEVARGDREALQMTLDHLQRLRILSAENGQISFLNFAKRQYTKPSDLPDAVKERVTKSRNAKRNALIKEEHAVKRDVSPAYRAETRVSLPDTDTDTDTESEKSDSVLSAESTAASAAPISFADTLDGLLNRCADPLVKNKNAVVVDAFRAVFGTSELSKYPLNAGRLGQLAGQCNGQPALIARIFEFGPAWVKAGRRGDPLDYVTKASHNQNGRANGRAPPLEPHYLSAAESAANQERLKREQDAHIDRGKIGPPSRITP